MHVRRGRHARRKRSPACSGEQASMQRGAGRRTRSPSVHGDLSCRLACMATYKVARRTWRPILGSCHAVGRPEGMATYGHLGTPNMLVWTFPVLFVAALGSLYLHLRKKNSDQNVHSDERKRWLALWRRPVRDRFRDRVSVLRHVYRSAGLDTGDLFTQATYPHCKRSGGRWDRSVAIEVSGVCVVDRADRECMFSVPVLPSGSGLLGTTSVGANVGGEHQVPYMAGTLDHDSFHRPRRLLHCLTYNPTSIMFVNVPSISKLQWHPFTVSSNSNMEADRLSVIIKTEGSWSTNLYRMLSSLIERLDVSIEGPYGPASNHFLRHDTVVMVSGGSGITPFISIIRELIFMSKFSQSKTPDIILIAIFKSSLDLTMLDLLLPMTGSPSELSNLKLRIEAYVTKEKEPIVDKSKRVRSVWFKPLPTDKTMAAILGPNSCLWLGAIISSSFIMFLILIGIITRFYIYPKVHNNHEFSTSKQAVLNVLAMCVSIAATASAAVFWNKRQYAREAMQVQNMEGQTPEGSPNIKGLIFECKGDSIGVLASGPTKLRHDVAAICSSGLVDNLHFESISFSW
ncbi:Ferric reduction oxidase 2 [Hibiscus syriacus]|uniref:ferric-chelate reductase (NADH) n=1 Tax=Hibiscus syriacus TaxID=106335 RepID=A0A6A2X9A9_HIBSY|nr:Ferric reduction oxidase 2 [Hibiscus syriacus]